VKRLCLIIVLLLNSCYKKGIIPSHSYGEILYRSKCSSCHNLLSPSEHPYEKFEEYVNKYGKKLSDKEKGEILKYLKSFNN
jgi:hypothetical protein